jgi:hypothetical protein
MDMTDYRSRYALLVAQDHIRDLHRAADHDRLLKGVRRQSEPRLEGRRRWSVAGLVDRLMPNREATPLSTTGNPEPL